MRSKKPNAGFTLTELALVLVIIGLLMAGMLRGWQYIQSNRVTKTYADVQAYTAAVQIFKDHFSAIPGDMPNATQVIQECGPATFCTNGDGDGSVGVPAQGGNRQELRNATLSADPRDRENVMFFKHLALAGLIRGISATANPALPEWGKTHPTTPLGGGFHVFQSQDAGNDYGIGIVLRMQSRVNAGPLSLGGGDAAPYESMPVSASNAKTIDEKYDDGLPDTGAISADYTLTGCDTGGQYQTATVGKICMMYFSLN